MNSFVSLQGLPEVWWPRKRYDVNPAPKEIFIKPHRKDDGKIGVNPSLSKTQYLDKQHVSPIQASHMSKAADDSRKGKEKSLKYKSHCSDRPEKLDHSPQECSDENSPISHCPRLPICEYTAPQPCPPNFLVVAVFPVLPKYKDLYTRVVASKGHMASDTKVKSMFIQATMVTELLETIQQMSELSSCDVTSTDLQRWRAAVDTASVMDFQVPWLDDQLHLLESKIHDIEELKATRRSLEAEVRGSEKKISLLRSEMEEARRAYEAAKVEKAELIVKVGTVKASYD
ncbi:hypothetical protein MKW92_010081, partial [Papaver armeniacum]